MINTKQQFKRKYQETFIHICEGEKKGIQRLEEVCKTLDDDTLNKLMKSDEEEVLPPDWLTIITCFFNSTVEIQKYEGFNIPSKITADAIMILFESPKPKTMKGIIELREYLDQISTPIPIENVGWLHSSANKQRMTILLFHDNKEIKK